MILFDEDDKKPKDVPPPSAPVAGSSSSESRPLLGTSHDHPILDADAGLAEEAPPPYSAAGSPLLAHKHARRRARKRFVRALLLGLAIWLGAALVVGRLTHTTDSDEVRRPVGIQQLLTCHAAWRGFRP
jgi:hypothetical protein